MMEMLDSTYSNIVSSWRAKAIKTREQLNTALLDYPVTFAYHSGRIENQEITYHDTRDIFEKGSIQGYSGNIRTLFEIQNLKTCNDYLLDCFERRVAFSEELLLRVHEILTIGTYDSERWSRGERPGSYKHHDYVVGIDETGVPSKEVPSFVRSLLLEIEAAKPHNILTVAAYFHGSLESIHPFADGNGRVGRALTNYLLILNDHPPIVIREDDRLAYYAALNAWDREADLDPLKTFFKAETIKTWGSNKIRTVAL